MFFITLGLDLGGDNSAARVLGQLVTGVGFLGAGVIMTKGDIVSGVTSAAVVWLLASLGASIGLGILRKGAGNVYSCGICPDSSAVA